MAPDVGGPRGSPVFIILFKNKYIIAGWVPRKQILRWVLAARKLITKTLRMEFLFQKGRERCRIRPKEPSDCDTGLVKATATPQENSAAGGPFKVVLCWSTQCPAF